MSNFNDGKPMNRDDANRVFWKDVYPAMFCNMNHFSDANKALDNGSVVGEFLDAVYNKNVLIDADSKEDPVMPIITPSRMNIFMSWINKFAMKIVVYNLRNDKDYRRSWVSSITVAQYDSEDPVAGSELFMDWLTR